MSRDIYSLYTSIRIFGRMHLLILIQTISLLVGGSMMKLEVVQKVRGS